MRIRRAAGEISERSTDQLIEQGLYADSGYGTL